MGSVCRASVGESLAKYVGESVGETVDKSVGESVGESVREYVGESVGNIECQGVRRMVR